MVTLQTDGSRGDGRTGSPEDLDRSDFATGEEAQVILDDDRADPNGLDGEPENGLGREGLPGGGSPAICRNVAANAA